MIVLDTCALIEIFKSNCGLSKNTLKQIDAGASILSISFAEIACKVKLSKLEMNLSITNLYKELIQIDSIDIVSIDVEDWLESIDLEWSDNRDPADRLIVNFAKKNKAKIVTSDTKIKKYYNHVIW